MMPASPRPVAAVPGSWRDPRSRVFASGDRILRGLRADGLDDFEAVARTETFRTAMNDGDIIDTWVEDPAGIPGTWAGALGHRPVPIVSYPYEWSFSMLQDAARLQLRVLRSLLGDDLWCKDGNAYNVMFDGNRPVFIDVGSFQPVPDGEPWPGYRQFCQTFLYPLLLETYLGVPFQPLLRSSVEGIDPAVADAMFRGRARWRRGVPTHVVAHARAERRFGARSREVTSSLRDAGVSRQLLRALTGRLERLINRLEPPTGATTWSDYSDRGHYPLDALAAKDRFVIEALTARSPHQVLDIGCNDGRFARLAAAHADHVVATDLDAHVIDRLYRSVRHGGPKNLLPLVLDIADPSPAIGWRSNERAAFGIRARPDLVLCLAVVHHLAMGRGVPLDEIVQYLSSFQCDVIVEVPDWDDPMVQNLLGGRRGSWHEYGLGRFEAIVTDKFAINRRLQLPGISRTMFDLSPLDDAR